MAAMELAPLVKVGGLADMVSSLSRSLARRGYDVTVVLPGYRHLMEHPDTEALPLPPLRVPYGGATRRPRLHSHRWPGSGVRVFLLEDPLFSAREGIYVDPANREEYPDAGDRYALFCRAVLEALLAVDLAPDILHVHDAQTALVPTFLRRAGVGGAFFDRTGTVLTIHNMGGGYQGVYPPEVLDRSGLGRADFYLGGPLEFWGQVNFLKAGLVDADRLTTVSAGYADEIRSGPEFGHGLEGVLSERGGALVGILNGIDTDLWNPATDPHLAEPYDADHVGGKAANRRALLADTGLEPARGRPVAGVISRLVEQKGVDLLRLASNRLLDMGLSLVVLGSGQPEAEAFFRRLAASRSDRVFYSAGFDDPLAHRIEAGADLFLMPSRYEPCGLNQMMSLRYGTVPVVRRVGGLADTVRPVGEDPRGGTGFVFDDYHPGALVETVGRALEVFADRPRWRRIMRRGMREDFSWERSATSYEQVYREAAARAGGPRE